jgi:alcohol dehydrogenase class IV
VTAIEGFRWEDGERIVRFGRGALADAPELLGEGYVLLTTPRAAADVPALEEPAAQVVHVDPGRVDELAGALRPHVRGELLVALGGGRVIDVAKALAAADPPRRVAAIPTTLSAAEMTRVHRHAAGVPAGTPRVRPTIVITDPGLAASQPEDQLAASAANALAHAIEGTLTVKASPVPTLAALEAARLLAGAWANGEADRDGLALGALLSGYAIDAAGYGLHHVMSQTLVRFGGAGHGPANACLLPHTVGALREHHTDELERVARAIGGDPEDAAADLARRATAERLRDLGIDHKALDECARQAAQRPELELTPPAPDEAAIRALYERAW